MKRFPALKSVVTVMDCNKRQPMNCHHRYDVKLLGFLCNNDSSRDYIQKSSVNDDINLISRITSISIWKHAYFPGKQEVFWALCWSNSDIG